MAGEIFGLLIKEILIPVILVLVLIAAGVSFLHNPSTLVGYAVGLGQAIWAAISKQF